MRTLSGILVLLLLSSCGGTSDGLNCESYCNVLSCTSGSGFDRSACLNEDCPCAEAIFAQGYLDSVNECGTRATCGQIEGCEEDYQATLPQDREDEIEAACLDYAFRCSLDANDVCAGVEFFALFSDLIVDGTLDCWENAACADVETCNAGVRPPVCSP